MTSTQSPKELATEFIASTKQDIAYLEGELAACILIGSPFMIVANAVSPDHSVEVVLGSFDMTPGSLPRYDASAKPHFRALSLVQSHLCGVSCYSPEKAEKVVKQVREQLPELTNVHTRHIRDEQRNRLERCRELLAHMEAVVAKLS